MLTLRFTRIDAGRHRFESIRADGVREVRELETRSLLLHDFAHFALESEGRLTEGFFGALAKGAAYGAPGDEAAMQIESVVGRLQSAQKGEIDPALFVAHYRAAQESIGATAPSWLDEHLLQRTLARLRQLQGQWRATPFGATMELKFGTNPRT